jgi:Fe(3+) dicitrate transport protein
MSTTQSLPEVSGMSIFAGRKTDVVLLQQLDANLATNQARQAFGKIPGIHIWESDGSGIQIGVSVRGLSANRSWEFNVRQNGYDISSDPFGYPEAYYSPPLEAVERLEVIRGSAALQYGPQTGGLLNYVMAAPANTPFKIESSQTLGSFGLFSSFNQISGTKGKWSYRAYVQHRQGKGWRDHNRFNSQHYHAHIGYQISAHTKLSAEYTHMNYVAQQPGGILDKDLAERATISYRSRNWMSTPWQGANLQLDSRLGTHTQLQVKVFATWSERNSIGYVRAATIPDTIDQKTLQYQPRQIDQDLYRNAGTEIRVKQTFHWWNQSQVLATGVRGYVGTTKRQQQGRGDTGTEYNMDLQAAEYPRVLEYRQENMSLFAEQLLRLNSKWVVTPGVRLEWLQSHAEGRLSFKTDGTPVGISPQKSDRLFLLAGISTEYHVGKAEHNEIYASAVQSYRPVTYAELTPSATTDVIDPDMKDVRTWNVELGYRGRVKDWLRVDVTGFLLYQDGRISAQSLKDANGQTYIFRTNVGDSRTYGLEWSADFSISRLLRFGFKAGEWVLSTAMCFQQPEWVRFNQNNNDFAGKLLDNAPQQIHRIGLNWSHRGISSSLQWSYTGAMFTDVANTVTPSSNAQSGQLAAYQLMDWSNSIRIGQHYKLRFGVNNLADVRYATRRAGGYPGPGLLPGEGRSFYAGFNIVF